MNKILFSDYDGIRNYENLNIATLSEYAKILPICEKSSPSLCIIKVDNYIDNQIQYYLKKHQFLEAMFFVKQFVRDIYFVNNISLSNWDYISNERCEK